MCREGGSEHFDPFKGASGEHHAVIWIDIFIVAEPFMSAAALGWVDSMLTDAMVENGLPGLAHAMLADLAAC